MDRSVATETETATETTVLEQGQPRRAVEGNQRHSTDRRRGT
jgi:hypothetical protein